MTNPARMFRVAGLSLAGLALGACGGQEGADYCLNHYLVHAEHQASLATLVVDVSDHGTLTAIFRQPAGSLVDEPEQPGEFHEALSDPEHVYSIPDRNDCVHSNPKVSSRDGVFVAEYESQCAQGTEIKLVNVSVLDSVLEIDEVEVSIQTPATSKHFAISRQCSAPVFRLNQR